MVGSCNEKVASLMAWVANASTGVLRMDLQFEIFVECQVFEFHEFYLIINLSYKFKRFCALRPTHLMYADRI